eukprot:GGOE01041225.1.p1 GENE.GGOE01041225.1~~GGOE01041225.1.p1  ORF type:complete len:400 (-),score=69.41 GGOE01041225.1:794-1993(-)
MGCGTSTKPNLAAPRIDTYVTHKQVEITSAVVDRCILNLSRRGASVGATLGIRTDLDRYTVLDISGCGLVEVPPQAWAMPYMTGLDVQENRLVSIDRIVAKRPGLRFLNISDNPIQSLGDPLRKLTQLDTLCASKCSISAFPNHLCEITSLTHLNLYNNSITRIPSIINQLVNIRELNLASNKLVQLPDDCFLGFHSLKRLALFWNRLGRIPSLADMDALEELQLNSNVLEDMPTFGLNHCALGKIDISRNRITQIPYGVLTVERFPKLHTLEMSHNQLSKLPADCCQLPLLCRLSLANNQLVSLPAEIWYMKCLVYLNLDGNRLGALPEEVGNLKKHLATLFISDNNVTKLPAAICDLAQLTRFSCKNNPLNLEDPETGQRYEAVRTIVGAWPKFIGL